jgi:hypothetical protein
MVSKATPIWVGLSFFRRSRRTFANPKIAEVFIPLEVIRGFLLNAK